MEDPRYPIGKFSFDGTLTDKQKAQFLDDIEQTVTAGQSSLSYGSSQYTYVWKTDKAWAGTCRLLTVKLVDGSSHTASFKFK